MHTRTYRTVMVTAIVTVLVILGIGYRIFGRNIISVMKIGYILNLIDDKFYFDIDSEKLTDYALSGMTIATDDPYTNYYGKTQFDSYVSNTENSYIGIGVIIGVTEDNECLKVVSALEGSPGERAGLLSGDIILYIDGVEVYAEDLHSVAEKLKGGANDLGKDVTLNILRGDDTFDVVIQKEAIEKDTVKSKMLSEDVGYIRITAFDRRYSRDTGAEDTYDEFKKEMDTFIDNSTKKLILDLRDNPGGDMDVVTQIADYLLPKGIITYTESKNGKKSYIYSDDKCVDMQMVVLVNNGSASASEVLTGALKDYERAKVVGTQTYGKGIVQTVYHLNDGSGISITTSKYYSPNGVCIHGIGIEPDYIVELQEQKPVSQLSYHEDTQLQKAIELLNN